MKSEWKAATSEAKVASDGSFEAVFSSFNVVDLDGDVTRPGAVKTGAEVIVGSWGHQANRLPVGKGVLRTNAREASVAGELFLKTEAGRNTYGTLKGLGPLAQWSYMFLPTKVSFGTFQGQPVRFLEQVEVFSVDPVLRGAGVGTRTVALKSDATLTVPAELASAAARARSTLDRVALGEVARKSREILEALDATPRVAGLEVPASDVRPATRLAAEWGIRAAQKDLGLAPVRVRWFREKDDALGYASPTERDAIWLRADLDDVQAAKTALHECRHRWQFDVRGPGAKEADELDAQAFAASWSLYRPLTAGWIGD